MRCINKFIVLAVLNIICGTVSYGAVEAVEWTAHLSDIKNGQAILTVTGTIKPGWHLYGFVMPDYGEDVGTPEPTELSMSLPSGVKAIGDICKEGDSVMHFDEFMNLNLPWITDKVAFVQHLEVASGTSGNIKGAVKYMACNENSCLPPDNYNFSIAVETPLAIVASPEVAKVDVPLRDTEIAETNGFEEAPVFNNLALTERPIRSFLLSLEIVLFAVLGFFLIGHYPFYGRWAFARFFGGIIALSYSLYLLPELFPINII